MQLFKYCSYFVWLKPGARRKMRLEIPVQMCRHVMLVLVPVNLISSMMPVLVLVPVPSLIIPRIPLLTAVSTPGVWPG